MYKERNLLLTGFCNYDIIHITWTNLVYKSADQRVLPQAFDILGNGIRKDKTNTNDKTEWTGIARHSRADVDAFAAVADRVAYEIAVQSFRVVALLQSIDVYEHQLYKSKVFFPNIDRHEDREKCQITSLLNQVNSTDPWLGQGQEDWTVSQDCCRHCQGCWHRLRQSHRQLGGKGDAQSRSCALPDLEANVDVQAMQAGLDKDSWRLHHHLGRAAIAVDKSWYDVLVPGLTATSELSIRRREVLHIIQKLAEAYWQALPINVLKYGMNFLADLPSVVEVMQTNMPPSQIEYCK